MLHVSPSIFLMSILIPLTAYTEDIAPSIIKAAQEGRTKTVKALLADGAAVNTMDQEGNTPLMWAARNGHSEIVKMLLAKGADVDTEDSRGATPLMAASGHGHTEVVKALLDNGADVNAVDRAGITALVVASGYGFAEIVKLLLDKGAELAPFGAHKNALEEAQRQGHTEIVVLLKKALDRETEEKGPLFEILRSLQD